MRCVRPWRVCARRAERHAVRKRIAPSLGAGSVKEYPQHRRASHLSDRLLELGISPARGSEDSAAGGAEHHREPMPAHRLPQFLPQPGPPEEHLSVLRPEPGEAPAGRRRFLVLLAGRPGRPCGLGRRSRRAARAPGHRPIRQSTGCRARLPRLMREALYRTGCRIHRSFGTSHSRVPPSCKGRQGRLRSRHAFRVRCQPIPLPYASLIRRDGSLTSNNPLRRTELIVPSAGRC